MLRKILFSTCFCLFLAPIVKADNVVITGGSVVLVNPHSIGGTGFTFGFMGTDFSAQGGGTTSNNGIYPYSCFEFAIPQPCANFRLGAEFNSVIGEIRFQGVNYQLLPQISLSGISITLQVAIVPLTPELLNANGFEIIAPFTLIGHGGLGTPGQDTILLNFSGQGIVTFTVDRQIFPSGSFLRVISLQYIIVPPGGAIPSEVNIRLIPEPTTLLLFAIGISSFYFRQLIGRHRS